MVKLDLGELSEICADFSGANYYIADVISPDMLTSIRSSLRIPYDELVVAFLDQSFIQRFKQGCAIGLSGFYWSLWPEGDGSLSWDAFARIRLKRHGMLEIDLGTWAPLTVGGFWSDMKRDDFFLLLQRIQQLVRARMKSGYAAVSQSRSGQNEWWLAVAGQRYGPYSADVLKWMAETGQIRPEKAGVWKKGMTSWRPLAQVPELAALVRSGEEVSPSPFTAHSEPPISTVHQEAAADPESPGPAAAAEPSSVDINKASRDELIEVLGLKPEDAERIIKRREEMGRFVSAEQVGEVLGMKPHQVHRLSKWVHFSQKQDKPAWGRVVDY